MHETYLEAFSHPFLTSLAQAVFKLGYTFIQLWSPVREVHGLLGVSAEQGHKDDQKDGALLEWGKAERVGVVQPGEEKASVRPYSTFLYVQGATRNLEKSICNKSM